MICHIYLREKASIPDVGSSKNNNFEFPTKDIASDNFLFSPPDNY